MKSSFVAANPVPEAEAEAAPVADEYYNSAGDGKNGVKQYYNDDGYGGDYYKTKTVTKFVTVDKPVTIFKDPITIIKDPVTVIKTIYKDPVTVTKTVIKDPVTIFKTVTEFKYKTVTVTKTVTVDKYKPKTVTVTVTVKKGDSYYNYAGGY